VLAFFIGVLVAVGAAAAVEALGATDDVVASLERLGVPTTSEQWSDIGTVAGIASLVGMLAGCLLGGAAGERWHAKLLTRALNPGLGPEGYARAAETKALPARDRRRRRELFFTRAGTGGSRRRLGGRKAKPAPPADQAPAAQTGFGPARQEDRREERSTAS